jgi:hypothetical protein
MNHLEYSAIKAINWSTLKKIDISPAWLRHCIDHPEEDKDKAAWRQGRATHCATLELERFLDDYVVQPNFDQMARDATDGSLRTNKAKALRDAYSAEWFEQNNRPDVEIISQEEMDIALRSATAIRANKHAMALLKGAACEQVIRWHDPETGIECKGRSDIVCGRIVDLKTTRRNTMRELLMDAARFDYHAQVAWYHDGAVLAGLIDGKTQPAGIFVNAPAASTFVDVVVLDMELTPMEVLEAGRRKYKKLIELYMGCTATKTWPGMASAPMPWSIPEWKLMEDEEND